MALPFQQSPTGTRKGLNRDYLEGRYKRGRRNNVNLLGPAPNFFSLLTSPASWFPFLELSAAEVRERIKFRQTSVIHINAFLYYMNNQELTEKRNK